MCMIYIEDAMMLENLLTKLVKLLNNMEKLLLEEKLKDTENCTMLKNILLGNSTGQEIS